NRVALRILYQLQDVFDFARSVWHWHGRRMGCWRFAGAGIGPAAMARSPQRHLAKRLLQRLFACGTRGAFHPAAWKLALDVLAWCCACAARVVYPHESAGVGGMERTSCRKN